MKKAFVICGTFLSLFLFSQNQKFSYEYTFVTDSTQMNHPKKELTILEVTPEGSLFYSREVYESDSIMKVNLERQLKATGSINIVSGMKKGTFRDIISKNYQENQIYQQTNVGGEALKVLDQRPMEWTVLSDKNKIGEWEVQKAETEFAGRKWTAWFDPEIPIQDGPYKFRGLPGLIVKIEDATHSHIFELKGISSLENPYEENSAFQPKYTEVSYPQYEKLYKAYRQDPVKRLRSMVSEGSIKSIRDAQGNPINPSKMLRDREKSAKENLKKENNLLELNLLK